MGLYLALTGHRLSSPADLLYAKLATHFVPSQEMEALRIELSTSPLPKQGTREANLDAVQTIVSRFEVEGPLPLPSL